MVVQAQFNGRLIVLPSTDCFTLKPSQTFNSAKNHAVANFLKTRSGRNWICCQPTGCLLDQCGAGQHLAVSAFATVQPGLP